MRIVLVDESTLARGDLTPDVLEQIAGALTTQAIRHFGPMWDSTGAVVFTADSVAEVPSDDALIVISDRAAEAGELGDHETNAAGRPTGRIFLGPVLDNGGTILKGSLSLSGVISHEVLEMIGDPYITGWSDGPSGIQFAQEVCDPCESDSYEIDGVAVSDFVGPRWFSAGPGPYNYLNTIAEPFTLRPGGYMITRMPGGAVQQTFGAEYPEWRRDTKLRRRALAR